jgi:membrane-bound ClpP family serine protease
MGWLVILFIGVSFLVLELLKVQVPISVVLGFCALLLTLATLKNVADCVFLHWYVCGGL